MDPGPDIKMAVSMDTAAISSGLQMEKCIISKHEICIPEALSDVNVFRTVFSEETWTSVLTETQRKRLQKYLPSFPEDDARHKQDTVHRLLAGDNFKFGNALTKFHRQLKGGRFSPDIAKYTDLIRRTKYREYRESQTVYYSNVLKEILINRQRILEAAVHTAPGETIHFQHFSLSQIRPEHPGLKQRIRRRCGKILQELARECGTDPSSSSSDSDTESYDAETTRRRQLVRALRPESPDDAMSTPPSGIQGTWDAPPQPTVNGTGGADIKPPVAAKRCVSPVEMTEFSLHEMLQRHKRRREEEPFHPEMSTGALTLEDIIMRVQTVKKPSKVNPKKRVRERLTKRPGSKVKAKVTADSAAVSESGDIKPAIDGGVTMTTDVVSMDTTVEEEQVWTTQPIKSEKDISDDDPARLFCVLRDLLTSDLEGVAIATLEASVRRVVSGDVASLVAPALAYLCGDGPPLDPPGPLVDRRDQVYRWTGPQDTLLTALCADWLELYKPEDVAGPEEPPASPPPPRMMTTYVVRPTSPEEKAVFQQQERERFLTPHRAFTYAMCGGVPPPGYECVVGPVKGVYTADSTNKAREHALLVRERPAYVTILTLVRDAVARLPNGQGTRADICELLRDSAYLQPGVPETQVNTVVSGALDRLHYEDDPCAKYDVNRKLWVYLHRNRTQDEFERLHMAQGAAVKAKKALQSKPRPAKKSKEPAVSNTPVTSQAPTEVLAPTPTVISSGSNDSFVNVESLSPRDPPAVPAESPQPQHTVVLQSPTPAPPPQPQTPVPKTIMVPPTASPGPTSLLIQPPASPAQTSVLLPTPASPAPTSILAPQVVSAPGTPQIAPPTVQTIIHPGPSPAISAPSPKPAPRPTLALPEGIIRSPRPPVSLLAAAGTGLPPGTTLAHPTGGKLLVRGPAGTVATSTTVAKALAGMTTAGGKLGQVRNIMWLQQPQQQQQHQPQGPQIITAQRGATVVGKPAASANLTKQNIKIQGGLVQTIGQSSAITLVTPTTTTAAVSTMATGTEVTVTLPGSTQQVTMVRGGKPATMVINKQLSSGTGRSSTSTTQTVAQIIQSGALGAKSAVIGGKPILLGGRSVVGGRVLAGGKPVQLIPGKQLGLIQQTPVSLQAPTATKTTVVSQLLQQQQQQQQKTATLINLPQGAVTATQATAQTARIAANQLPAGVVPRAVGGPRLVTVAPPQGTTLTQISAGGTVPTKNLVLAAGSMVPGAAGHISVQHPAGGQTPTRVLTQHHLLAGGALRPTIISGPGGRNLQNLQLVKTVLSGAGGGKPGQTTTILLAQPPNSAGGVVGTQRPQITRIAGIGGKPQSASAPIYARIISPPSGAVRLAALGRPGQVISAPAGLQGLSVVADPAQQPTTEPVATNPPQSQGDA